MFGCYPDRKRVASPLDVIVSRFPKYMHRKKEKAAALLDVIVSYFSKYMHREKEGAMFSSGYCLGRSGIVSFFRLVICDD